MNLNFLDGFSKYFQISNFIKIYLFGAGFHAEGRKDGQAEWHDDINSRFSRFCEKRLERKIVIVFIHVKVWSLIASCVEKVLHYKSGRSCKPRLILGRINFSFAGFEHAPFWTPVCSIISQHEPTKCTFFYINILIFNFDIFYMFRTWEFIFRKTPVVVMVWHVLHALKGTRFESVDAVKAKATQLLNSLTQDDLQHCFQQWKIRMERCRDRGGNYIERDNISIVWFFFNKGLEYESGFFIATPRVHQYRESRR